MNSHTLAVIRTVVTGLTLSVQTILLAHVMGVSMVLIMQLLGYLAVLLLPGGMIALVIMYMHRKETASKGLKGPEEEPCNGDCCGKCFIKDSDKI